MEETKKYSKSEFHFPKNEGGGSSFSDSPKHQKTLTFSNMSESIDSRKTYDKTLFFRTIFSCTSRSLHPAGISENSDKWDTIISF